MMRISFTPDEAKGLIAAAEDLSVVINQATNAVALLDLIMHGGDHDGHFGLADIAALTARALDAAHLAHNEALVDLATRLKQAQPKGGTQ